MKNFNLNLERNLSQFLPCLRKSHRKFIPKVDPKSSCKWSEITPYGVKQWNNKRQTLLFSAIKKGLFHSIYNDRWGPTTDMLNVLYPHKPTKHRIRLSSRKTFLQKPSPKARCPSNVPRKDSATSKPRRAAACDTTIAASTASQVMAAWPLPIWSRQGSDYGGGLSLFEPIWREIQFNAMVKPGVDHWVGWIFLGDWWVLGIDMPVKRQKRQPIIGVFAEMNAIVLVG